MNLKELRVAFREMAQDHAVPPLWSDATLNLRANEAYMQAVRRARLIEDGDTPDTCKIVVKATNTKNLFAVDKRVIYVRRVKLASQDLPLRKLSVHDADVSYPGWETAPAATPLRWMPWGDHAIKLIDPSAIDDTLHLIVVREPLVPLAKDADVPEIEERYHVRLVSWMAARCYMDQDIEEKYRPEEAKIRMTEFVEEFGPATSAVDEKWIHRKHGYDEYEGLY
jgi:hypothetical protein